MTRLLDRVPERVRARLDSWQFWMVIAYFALGFLAVAGFHIQATASAERAATAARAAASAQAQYRQCLGSIPQLRKINSHLRGVNDLATTLLLNSRANLMTTPKSDPQYQTRVKNFVRLEKARAKIAEVREVPVPSKADCTARLKPKR